MADTQDDSQQQPETPAVPAARTDVSVPELREWMRNWVANATGQSPDSINENAPLIELGMASRDAVAMASDIEDYTGVVVTATMAFRHPTIESLATVIVEGEPEPEISDDEDWTREVDEDIANIAIVGIATRFPGDMNTAAQTWQALLEGRSGISDLPEGRWEEFLAEPRIAERVAKARTRGGYLSDIKGFDAEFFALSKMEADNIDPQQRMALELTWEALEDAHIPASSLRGEKVAVYIGSSNNDYQFLAVSDPTVAHPYAITGTTSSIIANRVSYFYDFRGPSMAIDTACSSSLVAAHQGVAALRAGEADVAVVGGVNALITPLVTIGFDEVGGVLAPDGLIKSFSSDADGYARSEGGGMLIFKRLADARRDGDEIYAVIAGSAVNHDGRSNGMLAPNPDAQAEVLRTAYKDAGINPRDVDYIEAHGTGTILGDPIEADALGRVVGRGRPADRPVLLGAVKSNVGHLESAAGAASLAKMALALRNDKIPPSINYAGPNPYIDFEAERLKVADTVTDWPRYSGHAITGVSGFGFGGANAHLVLREVLPSDLVEPEADDTVVEATTAPSEATAVYVGGVRMDEYGEFIDDEPLARRESDDDDYGDDAAVAHHHADDEPELPGLTDEAKRLIEAAREELESGEQPIALVPLAVSGFLTSRKKATAAELADWIDSPEGRASSLESIGRSLSRRNHGRSRAVVLARDHDEAIKGLRAVAEGKQHPSVFSADGPVTNGPVWVLAGFGAQHRKMAKSLYLRNETFAQWINKVDALVQDERGHSIVEMILDDAIDYTDETCQYPIEVVQLVIFGIQVALGELLKAHGAKPAAVIGQSLGEAAAAYFAGGLSLEDATRAISSRAHLMGEGEAMLFGEWIRLMALVEYSVDEIDTVFADFKDLEACVYAAPTQTVIGGPPEQVDAIIARAESEGKFARKFQTKGASHTSQMDPLLGELAAELQGIEPRPLQMAYFSTVHEGQLIRAGGEPIHDVDYWKKGLRHSVYFTQGIRNAVDNGHTTFLELAPNPVALMQVGLTTADAGLYDAQLIATLARKQDEVDSMTTAMAQLFVYGHDLDFRTLFEKGSYAEIPPTRFKRKPHWLDVRFTGDASVMMPGNHVAMPDGRHVWEFAPKGQPDLAALVKSAAAQVLPDSKLVASEQRAVPGDGSRLVTTLTRHPGGASVQVHARIDESFTLVYDAVVSRDGAASALPAAVATGSVVAELGPRAELRGVPAASVVDEPDDSAEILQDNLTAGAGLAAGFAKWSPDTGETIGQRLGAIVGGAMGYEPEDLPWEVPLIELGLDSLMAVRIKNRVEYDFDLPPIQLTAVRDANLYAVEKLIQYAIEHRDEVDELAESQKGQTAEEIAAAQAELMGGATTVAELEAKLAEAGHPIAAEAAEATEAPEATEATKAEATQTAAEAIATDAVESQVSPPIPPPPTDPRGPSAAGPSQSTVAAASMGPRAERRGVLTQEAVTEALGSDVPPRDAAERVTFATWAIVTGKSPGGIFNELPKVDDETAVKIAERLTERVDEGTVTADDVRAAKTVEALAMTVRDYLEGGKVDGFVRTLRAPKEGSNEIPVFVFHAAGGSTVVYEPLLKRLPPGTPMYGIERVEGSIEERAREYVPKLMEINTWASEVTGEKRVRPFILAGWSLGGVLAYACAIGLKEAGADVRFVGLIDAVRPGEPILQTKEETRKRWDRYARFAERTFNVEVPEIPYEELEALDDEGQVRFVLDVVSQAGVQIPGGIIEHQRTSYLDQRAIDLAEIQPYDGHVTLYMADRYHDDAIYFEPAYATRKPDGGWGEFVSDLEVVHIGGEHIQAIDEPYIAKVGAHMSEALGRIQSEATVAEAAYEDQEKQAK
ncbi:beta-ketoacyl synthase family protein,acyltransferase family protein,phosphopantetheine-containing protein [Mycolicibacterium rhodesiae NBB3]|uniref:Beta-ketoacyl synthase family protein,acyltransferase family protein,phosphopantetheine-containing protein n=1 Tax=Mycolicibacterium rhodesiae (strain NBB3) TaxID=710685 RepID=G8RNM2_MYCRN|nr:polyketide synthase Pks13 [Mycolicibacterium rhodesiae]AEV72552.1 beta-ketoacyl synthase family protein,acyltransferase family protein,phosphopantetheine-containing protein [Mycolicibacterium rhodesiae NBB3]